MEAERPMLLSFTICPYIRYSLIRPSLSFFFSLKTITNKWPYSSFFFIHFLNIEQQNNRSVNEKRSRNESSVHVFSAMFLKFDIRDK